MRMFVRHCFMIVLVIFCIPGMDVDVGMRMGVDM